MRKNFLYSLAALMVLGLSLAGCGNSTQKPAADKERTDSMSTRIAAALTEIMDNKDGKYGKGAFVVYDKEADTLAVLDEQEYAFYSAVREAKERGDSCFRIRVAADGKVTLVDPSGK